MNTTASGNLYERALQVIPGGVNSPVRAFRSVGSEPLFIESAQGCRITDADGNVFLDFCSSWGPLISGHRHPAILEALRKQCDLSLTLGAPCRQEVLLAEFIIERLQAAIPNMERIRFVNSGTEAVMSALRLARGHTGRSRILKFEGCYHGHSDGLLVKAGSGLATFGVPDSAGVPATFTAETIVAPLNDLAALSVIFQKYGAELAAVIVEPIPANNGLLLQPLDFLRALRDLTTQHGTLLIFDEVISGFRIGFGGAAQHYGVRPDLATYGKIIGGGLPVGAFAGPAKIFSKLAPDGPVYQAGTLSGNPLAMSAGLAQLKLLDDVAYERLEKLGALLESEWAAKDWKVRRIGSIFWLYRADEPPTRAAEIKRDSMEEYARLHRYCLEQGVYLAPSGYEVGFLNTAMTEEDIRYFVKTVAGFS